MAVSSKSVSRDSTVGFLGMGAMGTEMTLNLLKANFNVYVWNRTITKCETVVNAGAIKCETVQDVVKKCDIILCCLSDGTAYKEVLLDKPSVLDCIVQGKGIVNFSSIDPQLSLMFSEAIHVRKGAYLEAPVDGSRPSAKAGNLVVMAAGDKNLYDRMEPIFGTIGKQSYFLGKVGNGLKMKLCTSTLKVISYSAFMECICLAEKSGLRKKDFIQIVEKGVAGCFMYSKAGSNVIEGSTLGAALKYLLENTSLTVAMAADSNQSVAMTKVAMDLLQKAVTNGSEDDDVTKLYSVIRES